MKKNLTRVIALWVCSAIGNIALAASSTELSNNDLCIALNNDSQSTVEFAGLVDPGYVYTVKPGETATLSRDHMVGACFPPPMGCSVSIYATDGTTPNGIIIEHVPRGARIFYNGPTDYPIDKNAKVKCGS